MGKLCAGSRAAGVHAKAREPKLAGSGDNAGSDLLSHTRAELARRPGTSAHAAWGNCVPAVELPAYTRKPANRSSRALEIMPAATYSPTPAPSWLGALEQAPMPHGETVCLQSSCRRTRESPRTEARGLWR